MSYTWNYPPSPPPSLWPPKKSKKKMNSKSTTSFLLPRLDDMVLFKPINTPCEDSYDFKEPLYAEKTRTATISQHLDRYNRWLAFADTSNSGKKMRATALDLQDTVQDLNSTISRMMMEIDRKILDLHDKTDAFVEAVQEGDSWQTNGNLLDLSLEELDLALAKDPQRNTEAQLRRLSEVIRKEADPKEIWDEPKRRRSGSMPGKLTRLVKEVQGCPGGVPIAFHLYIFLIARVFYLWDSSAPFGRIGSDVDCRATESLLFNLASESRSKAIAQGQERVFFGFALAKRTVWNSLPLDCTTCGSRAQHPSSSPFDDPFSPCRRANVLTLIEQLQKEAYGEIQSGIMLTLTSKLPKELCLLIFDFAMEIEDIPMDPRVFERDNDSDGSSNSTNRFNWSAKTKYRCPESLSSNINT